jgi:hypothetical protein
MNFKDFYLITEGDVYKTTYQSDRYGGDHIIGLTIEFINLNKHIDREDNVTWSWDLIIDNKDKVYAWIDEDAKGRRYDSGCYYSEKDESGNDVHGEPVKDPELIDEIIYYIKKEWPLEKREAYIHKKEVMKGLKGDATDTWNDILG